VPAHRIEAAIVPTNDGGIYYTGPSDDWSRPGRMWWSVPDGVEAFSTWKEVTVVYHEGVPDRGGRARLCTGGGNALLAHGVISRPTQDVDLFTAQEHGVQAAADAVQAALRRAGFQAERPDQTGGLSDMFPDIGKGLAEWIVTAAGGNRCCCNWPTSTAARQPAVMDIGPVLDLKTPWAGRCARWPAGSSCGAG